MSAPESNAKSTAIDRDRVRSHLWIRSAALLYDILDDAVEWMDEPQLQRLLRSHVPVDDMRLAPDHTSSTRATPAEALREDIEEFVRASKRGMYHDEIPVRCRNCVDYPPATQAWLAHWERLYVRCEATVAVPAASVDILELATRGYVALLVLFEEACADAGIVAFSDEFGTWNLSVRPQRFPGQLVHVLEQLPQPRRAESLHHLRAIAEERPELSAILRLG